MNTNTFPVVGKKADGVTDLRLLDWDTTAKKFLFGAQADRNYDYTIFPKVTSTQILSALNLGVGSLQMRFVIPGGNADGSDFYFPFPDGDQYQDLASVNSLGSWRQSFGNILYANSMMRSKGLQLQLRLSSAVLGTITLNEIAMLIVGK